MGFYELTGSAPLVYRSEMRAQVFVRLQQMEEGKGDKLVIVLRKGKEERCTREAQLILREEKTRTKYSLRNVSKYLFVSLTLWMQVLK